MTNILSFFERKILLENQQELHYLQSIYSTSHHQLHMQTLYIIQNEMFTMVKSYQWTAIEESSSTHIRWLSKINANILGIKNCYGIYTTIVWHASQICY